MASFPLEHTGIPEGFLETVLKYGGMHGSDFWKQANGSLGGTRH